MKKEIQKELLPLAAIKSRPKNLDEFHARKFYMETKRVLFEIEKTNRQYIIFYHREGKWWHTCERSMLIYYHYVSKRLGIEKLIIRKDNDYGKIRWKHGQIITSSIKSVKKKFAVGNLRPILETEEILVFKLERAISEEDMRILAESEKNKEAKFNSLVLPKRVYPKILQRTAILHRDIVNKSVNLQEARRIYYGDMGAKLSAELAFSTIQMANGRIPVMEYFREAIKKTEDLIDWMAFVKKFDMFDAAAGLAVAEKIVDLRDILTEELKRLETEEQKSGMKDDNE